MFTKNWGVHNLVYTVNQIRLNRIFAMWFDLQFRKYNFVFIFKNIIYDLDLISIKYKLNKTATRNIIILLSIYFLDNINC